MESHQYRCGDSGAMMKSNQTVGEKKVTRTCNSVLCSQLELVMEELHDSRHITAEDISRVSARLQQWWSLCVLVSLNIVEQDATRVSFVTEVFIEIQ